MKKELLNGTPIPYDLSVQELSAMLASPAMKDFALACEALSHHTDPKAYEIMRAHINDRDKYRRLYILETIFRHRQARELVEILEAALTSDDILFVKTGLSIIAATEIKVSEDILLTAVRKHLSRSDIDTTALKTLEICEGNYLKLTKLFNQSEHCAQKEVLCDLLYENYLPAKARQLFDLCRRDQFPQIRLFALKLGKQYGFDIWDFSSDPDGHIRKEAQK